MCEIELKQCDRYNKGVVFTTALITQICQFWVQPAPSYVVLSLDKTLYDDYLWLVTSNEHQM